MDLVKIEIKENNIYMKWILSQEGVQILKKYDETTFVIKRMPHSSQSNSIKRAKYPSS